MKFRSAFGYDPDVASFNSGLDCSDAKDMTQQHFKTECDINTLVKTFAKGVPIPGADIPATHVVFDEIFDYQTAMNAIIEADRSFAALPSQLRQRFQNDPAQFLAFVQDDKNRDEAIELGLIPKPAPIPPVPPAPATPEPPAS